MIRYRLKCDRRHEFEAWFANSTAFDRQAKRHEISCPRCGTTRVQKALMTPSVARRRGRKRAKKRSGAKVIFGLPVVDRSQASGT